MSSEPLPDHYKALGIDKNADAATIKKTYRKLVLTCHPDKVTDEALKAQKQDEFHKIQQAYETLSDETRRATYEAELKLQQLRREKLARLASGSTVEPKNARFAQTPSGGATYTGTSSSRYTTEERKPSTTTSSSRTYYDEERYDSRRKADDYFTSSSRARSPRPSPPHRSSREKTDKYYEKDSRSAKSSSDRTRSSTTKARDNERRDRTQRFPVDSDRSSDDDKAYHERGYKTRSAEDESRRRAEEYRRDDRRGDDLYENQTPRKLSVQEKESEARLYMHKARAEVESKIRPSPVRTSSRDYYEPSRSSRHQDIRPDPAPRRSSAKPRERLERRGTDRVIPEVVEWDHRPAFKQSSSSPADIRIPTEVRSPPHRSQTESYRRSERSPTRPFGLSRSATMPTVPGSEAGGSRREAKSYPRPSALRNETNGSPERDAYPTIPAPQSQSKTYYSYNPAEGGVKQMDPSPHHTVLREPGRTRHRSPSPLSRPPMGANRPGLSHSKTYASGRSSRPSSPNREDRGRSTREQMKYGEVPSEYTRRQGMHERQPSFSPHKVSYAPSYGPEDVRWAPRRGDESRSKEYKEYRPSLSRTATSVY